MTGFSKLLSFTFSPMYLDKKEKWSGVMLNEQGIFFYNSSDIRTI